jgi:hypothetical protein
MKTKSHSKYAKTMNGHCSICNIQETMASAQKMQGKATMQEMEEIDKMIEMEENHKHDQIVSLDSSQVSVMKKMNLRFHVKIRPDENDFCLDNIPAWIDRALLVQNKNECAECFTVLCKFARADESQKTGLAILQYCCKLSLPNSYKALDMLMGSEFLYNLLCEHASERSLLLDWICKLNFQCQFSFWEYASRMWNAEFAVVEFANILNCDRFKHLKNLFSDPAMQQHFQDDIICNQFIADLLYKIGHHHCERTALFFMKSWAGDLAEELIRWLLLTDRPEKWAVFFESQKALPITWDGIPNWFRSNFGPIKQAKELRNGREQALSHVFKTRILKYNNNNIHDLNNRWSIQQIRQWLIVCYDQPRHQDSYFFKCWLRDLDSTGHLLCWRPGCQYVILQLLELVFICKIEHEKKAKENIENA